MIKSELALCSCTRLLFIFIFCCSCLNPNGSVFLSIAFECIEKAEAERPCGVKRPCLLYQYKSSLDRASNFLYILIHSAVFATFQLIG